MTLRFLIRKELKQFVRNQFLPKLIIVFPVMIMLVIPWIVNMDIRNIRLSIVNQDGSSTSEKLIQRLEASSYFILTDVTHSYREALRELELGGTDAVVEIPKYFEQSLISGEQAPLQISINAVNHTKGALGSNYLSAVCSDFYADNFQISSGTSGGAPAVPRISISVMNKFNPLMDYKIYMIPAYMVIVIILLGGFLPALNIVGEKEKGTIEQINITPVRKTTFIFAKLIPYWVLGILVLSVCMLLAWLVYGLSPGKGIWTVYLFSVLFIFAISGFGLTVSNYSDTMQQAMFVMFFFILIFMLMSGLLTPISSMPRWAQVLTWLNPPRYFIEMLRGVYLQGCTLTDLGTQLLALLGFDVFFGTWAVLSYRKTA